MSCGSWQQAAEDVLARLAASHLHRRRRVITSIDATHVRLDGCEYVNFASNNYLGLTHHPQVVTAIEGSLRAHGAGSGASSLITGFGPEHERAERRIALWKGTEGAVLLPSGYQANHAAVQTLAAVAEQRGKPIRFLLDKLSHASLIDAVRGTGAPFRILPHNGIRKLKRLLEEAQPNEIEVVVTESIFSMDGDAADLRRLSRIKSEHPFMLLLDEAHATGVYGTAGHGLADELGLRAAVDVSVITFSKATGIAGGAVCGSAAFCESVVNVGRAYIYSTSIPPMLAAGASAAVGVMQSEPQHQLRVRQLALHVRSQLLKSGWEIPAGDSPIIPVIFGPETAALQAAEELKQEGMLVLAIRPPTVQRGASRLRVTISSAHSDEEVERLISALIRLRTRVQGGR